MKTNPGLLDLLKKAKQQVDAMSPEARAAMLKAQGESWARSEAYWPKAKYHFENGVKIYDSYEDYLND